MKRMIVAATEQNEALDEAIDNLKADFDYIIEGLEKLGRTSKDKSNEALGIALSISENLSAATQDVADAITM